MGKFTKDKRDIYYRKAKEDCFRARSAYKLLQIDEVFGIFENAERVIDLCAAPGSWSQVVSKKLTEKGLFKDSNGEDVRIISIDLQEMAPIDNVVQLQGDITKKETVDEILHKFKGNKANLVIDDGAPDVTGFHDIDQYLQSQLMVAALNICNETLKKGGHFVAKIFKGTDIKFLYSQFKLFFKSVYVVKPKSSRASSVENFLVCLQYDPPQSFENSTTKSLYTFQPEIEKIQEVNEQISKQTKEDQKYYKFVTCGDLSGFDEAD
ncbi:ribosomal RNA large subunit methyltransferase (macronuclear) [Tetrahymena thermophila SB210]|uniref:Putative tRNA (cytidine(32)/guanosine(34)-2'-O)-methyltransferase n=1 Tax=Tetrahymena thermophila (strain SB210) TaxID=312017 RepID=I7MGM4_TETTS|nr:ribosomal RNA large subunit methyltransferase [Tetrahymena thermophila SB210]EAS01639.3 ribosomal RNA large subunit methyltransferase [Tetrahymena thermophila SB210]|eukprot:XP_001021884.3 ribosomal RNA large subunit methyltransferase [Tetrahymena thermophila SB210]